MTQGHRKPGGTPLTGVTFSNGRPKPVQFTVTATNTSGVNLGTSAMQPCPGQANGVNGTSTFTPPANWEDVCTVGVRVYAPSASDPTVLGGVGASTPSLPPNPQTVASTATCTLGPFTNSSTNDCSLQLYDDSTPARVLASGVSVVNQNPS